ncbi:unnamed protein product, partial [Leptidea sinapis]
HHSILCLFVAVVSAENCWLDDEDIGAEVVIGKPATSVPSTSAREVSYNDKNFDSVVEEWLQLTNLSDDDDDFSTDLLDDRVDFITNGRNALTEPACLSDLRAFQAEVLRTEDERDDRALRDIVPDDCYLLDWNKDRQVFKGQQEVFTATYEPTFRITDLTRPIDIFYKMFDDDFLDLLCIETNRYAVQKIALLREQNKLSTHSRLQRWTPTNRDEVISFLAIIILQSLYPLPEEEGYFGFNGFGTMAFIGKIMSFNRFLLLNGHLWKFFVYTGKDTSTNTADNHIQINNEELTIDRAGDDQTNERPESDRSTVLTDRIDKQPTDRPTNATAKIVYTLIEPLLNRGHTLVMDNFYNSPLLLRCLKKQKTDCYGTLRLNREFVPETMKTLTKTDLRHGEAVASYCSDLSVLVWRDANLVSMISTFHNLQIGTTDKYNRLTYKPSVVLDYNKSMGGIDRKDQFLSAQPIERLRNRVWYKKLFRRLYSSALFNCFVIFSGVNQKISHRKFRTVLAEELLLRHRQVDLTTECRLFSVGKRTGQVTLTARRNIRHKTQSRPTVDSNHFPIRTGSKYTVCVMCPKKSRTIWKCEEFDVNLCIEDCFKMYHKP